MFKYWKTLTMFALLPLLVKISKVFNQETNFFEDLQKFPSRVYEEENFTILGVTNPAFGNDKIPVVLVLCQKDDKQMTKTDSYVQNNNKFFKQAKVLLKSIAMATEQGIKKFIGTWPNAFQTKLFVEYHTFTPRKECMDKKLFKLCASVRMFLHEILPGEDSIIYVDSDFIFLESPEKLFHHFQKFNHMQFIGAAHNGGFYEIPTFFHSADYYYYGNTGISSGMLLMNLTRIKELKHNWTETVYSVCRSYKKRLRLYDQGVYNILFSEFENSLYELDCRWSYSVFYCRKRSLCYETLKNGNIFAVHGSSYSFLQNKSKKLKVLFQVFEKFELGNSISELISNLKFALKEIEIIQPEDTDGCKSIAYLNNALLRTLMQKSQNNLAL